MNKYTSNINRIEFILTYACTGRCKHCSEGEHSRRKEQINTEYAIKAVRDLAKQYKIESVMTFGGEPLLCPEAVYAIHREAMKMNIQKRQLITNGFFSRDREKIKTVAEGLAECGVNDVLISADAFHQETIPIETVKEFANTLKQHNVPTRISPAWLVDKQHKNHYNRLTRKIVDEFVALGIPESEGNIIFPAGNAVVYLADYFDTDAKYINPYEDDPFNIHTISISPDGNVDIINKNIYQTDILQMLKEYSPGK